jgi:hypothetical protein
MANVPSAVKFTKNGVEFTSNVDRVNYTIQELSRAALRDVGKYVIRQARTASKARPHASKILIKSRFYGKSGAFSFWVRKQETDLLVGIKHNTWYGALQELGDGKQPKRGILTAAVQENIDQIRLIEGQYLSAIEDENRALGLIDDEEYEPDGSE